MKLYQLNQNNLFLPATGGATIALKLTPNSGRIVYRDKINTLIGIKHPGIELGIDQWGYKWYVHHHYKNVKPTIEREDAFSLGETIFYDPRPVAYDQYSILERALAAWWNGQQYHWLWQNCQHFVNRIAKNKSHSEAIDKVSDAAMFFGGLAGIIGILTKNPGLTKIGLGVCAGGAIGKALSR